MVPSHWAAIWWSSSSWCRSQGHHLPIVNLPASLIFSLLYVPVDNGHKLIMVGIRKLLNCISLGTAVIDYVLNSLLNPKYLTHFACITCLVISLPSLFTFQPVLFTFCASNELFFAALYLIHFSYGPVGEDHTHHSYHVHSPHTTLQSCDPVLSHWPHSDTRLWIMGAASSGLPPPLLPQASNKRHTAGGSV